MRKRISSLVLIAATTVALTLPTQAHAAFQPGKFFSNLKDRVGGGVQRLYLRAVPGNKDGKAVVMQSTMAMEDVTSYNFNVVVDGSLTQNDEKMGTMKFTMDGPVEVQSIYDPNTMKQDWKMTAQVQVEGIQISGAGEMILDGQKAMYAKLTEIPLPMQEYKKLKDQWMKIDLEKMKTEDQPEMTEELQEKYMAAAKKLNENATFSEARKEKLDDTKVFVVDAEVGEDALMTYMEDVYAITAEATKATQSAMTAEEKEQLRTTIGALSPMKIKMWINRKNFYLVRAEVPLRIDVDEFSKKMAENSPESAQVSPLPTNSIVEANIQMNFDKFNEPVSITIPTDARPAEEVMQELMGGTLPMGTPYGAPAYGSGYSAPAYPGYGAQELPDLTPEQEEMLRQYGY